MSKIMPYGFFIFCMQEADHNLRFPDRILKPLSLVITYLTVQELYVTKKAVLI